ncbi:MAG: EamA family transporter [Candidatus Woesearchaeota archaeon]
MFKLLIFISLILGTAGQLMIKKGAGFSELKMSGIITKIKSLILNYYVVLGILITVVSAGVWIVMLNRVELSYAYPMVSLTYIFIAIFSKIFFKENVSKMRWLSIAIITAGVILVTLS